MAASSSSSPSAELIDKLARLVAESLAISCLSKAKVNEEVQERLEVISNTKALFARRAGPEGEAAAEALANATYLVPFTDAVAKPDGFAELQKLVNSDSVGPPPAPATEVCLLSSKWADHFCFLPFVNLPTL